MSNSTEDQKSVDLNDIDQKIIDNTNTESIAKNAESIATCISVIKGEITRATEAETKVLNTAKEYTDTCVSTSLTSLVQTVNNITPDANGNITLTKVPLAENLYTSDVVVDNAADGFIFRTTGGAASITNGEAYLTQIRGNTIKVNDVYVSSKPLTFISTGFNQFNPANVLNGCNKITDSTIVVDESASTKLAYVHVAGGLSKGYTIHSLTGSIIDVGWCKSVPQIGSSVEMVMLETTEESTVENCSNYKYTLKADGEYFDDGYFCIVCTDTSKLSVHPHWSGPENWRDEDLDDYTDYKTTVLTIPLVDINGESLPVASYGIPSVNSVYDEYDFEAGKYYQRIARKDFSTDNLEYVRNYGTSYIEDGSESIYYILKDADCKVFDLTVSFSNLYTVCDYGTEEFVGTTVPVMAKLSYLPNLRDKLRTDVLTITEQDLTDAQKLQVQKNLHITDDSLVTKSVNNITPDEKGNITIEKVEYANNLYSTDNIVDKESFVFRTAGGYQSINNGMAEISEIHGSVIAPVHVYEDISFTKSEKKRFSFSINKEKWVASSFGELEGTYTFIRDNGEWKYNSGSIDLDQYGIEFTPTTEGEELNFVDGDKLIIVYTIVVDGNEKRQLFSSDKIEANHLSVSIDNDKFSSSAVGSIQSKGSTKTYTFTYEIDFGWNCDGVTLADGTTLADYGINVVGKPTNNDSITVTYTKQDLGKIYISKPTSFKSVLQNQFDNSSMYIVDCTIDDNGKIVSSKGKYVAYAYVTGSISQKDDRGYTVYNQNGGILKVGYTKEFPVLGLSNINLSLAHEDAGGNSPDVAGEYTATIDKLVNIRGFKDDGYIVVASEEIKHLNIHPRWSGYENLSFNKYSETVIEIPTTGTITVDDTKTTYDLPTKTIGIPRVNDEVYDILNFDKHTYTKNVEIVTYSKEKLDEIATKTSEYIFDSEIILYKLETPIVYDIDKDFSYTYEVDDFGTERYYGTNVDTNCIIIYGDNLRDKLRSDVITYSNQSSLGKSDAQKAQARKNINAASDSEVVKSVNNDLPDSKGNVTISKVALADNLYSSDNVSDKSEFIARTSGGEASISNGTANLLIIYGNTSIDKETGKITIAKPIRFRSVGFNAFDKESMVISGYNSFGLDGKIVNDTTHTDYKLCYVRMPISDNRGWQIYNPNNSIVKVGWCKTLPTTDSTIITLDKNDILSENNNDVYVYNENGYLVIVTTDIETLCVHPRWSGRSNWHDSEGFNDYEAYTSSVIEIPTSGKTRSVFPTAVYGMPRIGDVADMIDFSTGVYTKKIEYMQYSEDNLEYAQSQSDTVIHDDKIILYILKNFESFDVELNDEYTVCDYGTEIFEGTEVALTVETTYGDNLKDKLRTDVVTYSNQATLNKSDSQKAQARKNINALGIGEGVTSVNGTKPSVDGNLTLNEVPYANNLISIEGQEIQTKFVYRTSGGSATITNGSAYLSYLTGNANIPQHTTETLTIASEEVSRLNPTIIQDTWVASKFGETSGEYIFNYNGDNWNYTSSASNEETISLSDLGITVQNYSLDGDKLTVNYSIEETEVTEESKDGTETKSTVKTYNVSIFAEEKPHFGSTLDKDTFKASTLGEGSGQYKLIHENNTWNLYKLNGNVWDLNKSSVTPSEYGIVINGTPINGDTSLINFTKKEDGKFSISKPTKFKSIGFNQFKSGLTYDADDEVVMDPDHTWLYGYTISDEPRIVKEETEETTLCYAHVVGGLTNGYQIFFGEYIADKSWENYGTKLEDDELKALNYKVYWTDSIPTTASTLTLLEENKELSEDTVFDTAGNKAIRCYNIEKDGYIVFTHSMPEFVCIHPRWSGTVNWRDAQGFGDWEQYHEDIIEIPTLGYMSSGTSTSELTTEIELPTAKYGIPSIGDITDKLDFDNLTYTQYISGIEYSAQNLSNVISKGVAYSYDNELILFQLDSPITYKLDSSIANEYEVCDYGTEEFIGNGIEVNNSILYGQSLKDKLRRDVVTISSQTLTDSEKSQVGVNIGLRYKLVTQEIKDWSYEVNGTFYRACYVEDFAINTVEIADGSMKVAIVLPAKPSDGRARDFIVRIVVTSTTAPSITFIGQDEVIDYESTDDDWQTIEPGSNLFAFTETQKASV